MKKVLNSILLAGIVALSLSSCMIHEHIVGNGPQGSDSVRKKAVFIIGNRIVEVDTKDLADGATDYKIDTRMNGVDLLITMVTVGIVNTRTVTVTR